MRTVLTFLATTLLAVACCNEAISTKPMAADSIIPKVNEICVEEGEFEINKATALVFDAEVEGVANYLLEYLPLEQKGAAEKNYIRLAVDNDLEEEAYELEVSSEGITIEGGSYGGVFNGVQSLLQMIPATYAKGVKLPLEVGCAEIKDSPRFAYRGLLLDVARTFIPAERVKRYIDLMAYHKMNKLHFHLIDDEGWRIEIKSHPEFALEAGFRGGDAKVWPRYAKFDEKWGGYYTHEELRDIVAYAAQRNIEVIPEIDVPGHSRALAQICPDILCNYTPDKEKWQGRDLRNAWCVSKEQNFALIDDIIREVADIFPSPYIHIGGDEVALALGFHIWSKCPDCQRMMRKNGFTSYMQLQDIFTERVVAILDRYGKKPAVWNESIEGGRLDKSTRVHAWLSLKHCKECLDKGYRTIIMPGHFFYLDSRQSAHEPGHKWAGHFDAKKVSSFDFVSQGFTPENMKFVEGVSAAFWSENYIKYNPESNDYLDYMLFPRMCVIAEMGWCSERRSWDDMHKVLSVAHYDRLSNMGVVYRLESPSVEVKDGKIVAKAEEGQRLYYTDKFTGKTRRYTSPLDASLASRVAFRSEYRTGHSADTALKAYYEGEKPAVAVTTSFELNKRYTLADVEAYKSVRSSSALAAGEWIEYRFVEPVECLRMTFATGHPHLHRCIWEFAYAEVSYDGENFENVGRLVNGAISIEPKDKIVALRVTTDGLSDAEPMTIIEPLKIEK